MTTTTQRSQRPLKMNQIHPRQKLKQHAFFGRENHNVYRDENSTRSSHLFHEMEAYWLIEMHHRSMSTSYDRHEKRRSKLAVHPFLHPANDVTSIGQMDPAGWRWIDNRESWCFFGCVSDFIFIIRSAAAAWPTFLRSQTMEMRSIRMTQWHFEND